MMKLARRWREVRGGFENERFLVLVHYRFFFENQLLCFSRLFGSLLICVSDSVLHGDPKFHHF